MIYKTFAIFIFSMLYAVSGADFFSYFGEFTSALYTESEFAHSQYAVSNGWDRICGVYSGLHDFRMKAETDTKKLSGEIETVIKELNKNSIVRLSPYEKDFLTALMYGSLAYIESSSPSAGMVRNIRRSGRIFDELEKKYRTQDSSFGSALKDISLGLYFEDSFWIRSVMRHEGNIFQGLKHLTGIASAGKAARAEASLFLIEYYSDILHDHNSSLIYSKILAEIHPGSRYFKYLLARDLYHSGKIREAKALFTDINNSLGERFYPYDYDSIIFEAKCSYLTGDSERGEKVTAFAKEIHDGSILENFRNDWVFSVRMRQDLIFRIQNQSPISDRMADDELRRSARILFEHGFFRELKRLLEKTGKNEPEMLLLGFRTAVIMNDWENARNIAENLRSEHKKFTKDHHDSKRIGLLFNITDNFIKNAKTRGRQL